MSQENANVVRAVVEAQRRRDWQAFRRLYDPDIEWEDVSGLWGDWGMRRGFEEVRDAWLTWFEAFEQVNFEIEELIEAGDKVVAFIRARARAGRAVPSSTSAYRACGRCAAGGSCE